jgi:hypothetical protein
MKNKAINLSKGEGIFQAKSLKLKAKSSGLQVANNVILKSCFPLMKGGKSI